jgi:hypothetical protein
MRGVLARCATRFAEAKFTLEELLEKSLSSESEPASELLDPASSGVFVDSSFVDRMAAGDVVVGALADEVLLDEGVVGSVFVSLLADECLSDGVAVGSSARRKVPCRQSVCCWISTQQVCLPLCMLLLLLLVPPLPTLLLQTTLWKVYTSLERATSPKTYSKHTNF